MDQSKRLEGCFCASGYQQLEVIGFLDKYEPVVEWTTFHLFLSVKVRIDLE